MEVCDYNIAQEISADCQNPLVPGFENDGIIGNLKDIESVTYDPENKCIVTGITMKSGKKCFPVMNPGRNPFTGTNTAFAAGSFLNGFTKTVNIVVLKVGAEVSKNIIDPLANGAFFVILKNKNKGEGYKNAFEIYGLEAGLYATALDNDKYSTDTKGGWAVTLQESDVPHSGIFFLKSGEGSTNVLAATNAAMESLCTASGV